MNSRHSLSRLLLLSLVTSWISYVAIPVRVEAQVENPSQADRPDWQPLLETASKSRMELAKPIEPDLAFDLLVACYAEQTVPRQARDIAQYLFFESVWLSEINKALALDNEAGEARIVEAVQQQETKLTALGVPQDVARSGRLLIANFYFQRKLRSKLMGLLDDPETVKAVSGDEIIPLYYGSYLNFRGLLAMDDSNFSDAVEFHNRALDIREQLPPPFNVFAAQSLNNLALLSLRLGDYAAAKDYLRQAIVRHSGGQGMGERKIAADEMTARVNWAKAIEYAEVPRDYNKVIRMLRELETRTVASQQMAATESERAVWTEVLSLCRNNLALALYNSGRFAECEQFLLQVAKGLADSTNPQDIHLAECDINLGWAKLANKQPDEAERFFRSALEQLTQHHPGVPRIPEAMSYLARIVASTNPAESRSLLDHALDLREAYVFDTLSTSLSERNRLAFIQNVRVHPESISWPGEFDTYLELASTLDIPVDEQYRRVLIWKGALARVQAAMKAGDWQRIKELESERTALRQQINNSNNSATPQVEPSFDLPVLERRANELDDELRSLRSQRRPLPRPPLPSDIQRALPPGTAFLDIIEFRRFSPREEGKPLLDERQYGAFIVTAQDLRWIDLGSRQTIDRDLMEFRSRLQYAQDVSSVAAKLNNSFGKSLRQQLGNIDQLIVSGDGRFNALAWAALADPSQTGKKWVDWVPVINVSSAQSFIDRSQHNAAEITGWVTVGNVDYGPAVGRATWKKLEQTGVEARAIDQVLSGKFPLLGKQPQLEGQAATKASLLKFLTQKSIVHIATHGKFFGDGTQVDEFAVHAATSPLDSLLVLANANSDASRSMSTITAEEIGGLELSNVRLLVLSACQTGLGYVQAGQGLVGLTSAFEQAGVQSTVASLWKVDDDATRILMELFYESLVNNPEDFPVADALRHAQLKLKSMDKFKEPYYWAPWIIVGSPGTANSK